MKPWVRRRLHVMMAGLVLWAIAATPAAAQPIRHDRVVSGNVTAATPHALDGRVLAFAQVGNRMIVGGTFTQITEANSSTPVNRPFLFAFDVSNGAIDHSFAPALSGWVESLAPAPDGQSVYVAGQFRTINGQPAERIAKLRVSDGAFAPGFNAEANGRVNDVVVSGNRLFLGGIFGAVNGQTRTVLAAVDTETGALDPNVDLEFSDPNLNRNGAGNLSLRKIDATPDGTQLVALGNYSNVDGQRRHQVSIIDIASRPARVTDWHTEAYRHGVCSTSFASYTNDMEITPDGSYFVIGTTGAYRANTLCDTIARWNLGVTGSNLLPEWADYTGGDTIWGVGASGAAVYAGGHMRWVNNPFAGDRVGPGAVEREGLAALDPRNGVPFTWDPGRAKGVGVFDMYSTPDRLWVGSDTDRIARFNYRGRLAAFPLSGGTVIQPAHPGPLPGDLYAVPAAQLPTDPSILYRVNAGGPAVTASDALPNWAADTASTSPYRNSGSNAATWSTVTNLDSSVPAHAPRELFSSERWDPAAAPEMRWSFPLQTGRQVQVRLYLSNRCTCTQQVGQRVFDVQINGQTVLSNYDIVADVGHDRGVTKTFTATGSNDAVVIEFIHRTENPLINGIEIIDPALAGPLPEPEDGVARYPFDGQSVGSATTVGGSGINGAQTRDGFMLSGQLYTANGDGNLYVRSYDGTTFGQSTAVDLNGLGSAQFPVANITGIFYEHGKGRLWYTVAGQSRLYYRYFTAESDIVGAQTFNGPQNLTGLDWRNVRGMHLAHDGNLYYGSADGNLRRIAFNDGNPSPTTIQVLSGPATGDGKTWNNAAMWLHSPPGYQAPNMAPIPKVSAACEDLVCRLGSTGSRDPDGDIVSWQWSFGDGSNATGPGATHTYAAQGIYTVTLTTTDNRGATASASVELSVPWAVADMSASCIDLTCTFDASASTGRGGVADYSWNFGDGQTGSGPVVEHTYAQAGTFQVALTVTDTGGSQDTTTQRLAIGAAPAGITFAGQSAVNGNFRAFNLAVPSNVRGGDTMLLFLSLNKETLVPEPLGLQGWTELRTLINGNLRTTVWAKTAATGDEDTPVSFEFNEFVKGDALLVAHTGTSLSDPIDVSAGVNETTNRAAHTTPQVNATSDGHWVVSYWADRSSATTAWSTPTGQTERHEAAGPGGGRISAVLSDFNGPRPAGVAGGLTATADSSTNRATMWTVVLAPRGFEAPEDVPPVAQITAECSGLTCYLDGSDSVDGSAPITDYDWDFGDGQTASGAVVEHLFPDGGTYEVALTVTDEDGMTATATEEVTVTPPVVAAITASCTDLTCQFDGSASSGGGGAITGYTWDFGDGSAASTAVADHTYGASGEYEVSLTVMNSEGESASDAITVTVDESPDAIEFAGVSHTAGQQRVHELMIPQTVRGGDGLLLFVTINTDARSIGDPSGPGWVELDPGQPASPADMPMRVWQRVAQTGDDGQAVTVELDGAAKTDATLLAYSGTATSSPIAQFAAAAETVRGAGHTTPTLTTTVANNKIVSYWAEKSSATTTLTAPDGQEVRSLAVGTGGGRIAALATDSGPNAAGTYGGLTAVADSESAKATMWTLVLAPR